MKVYPLIAVIFFSFANVVFANAPVIDLSQNSEGGNPEVAAAPASMVPEMATTNATTLEQRIANLERQVNNLTQMNLPGRLEELQQEIQKLNGQSEQQNHDVKTIKDQLNKFYRDLNQRITSPAASSLNKNDNANLLDNGTNLSNDETIKAASDIDQQSIPKEQKAYEDAFNDLQQKKYSFAAEKLRIYLKNYPKGAYTVNAHYWLAECYYLLNQFNQAASEFKIVIDKYPSSTKIPDALLKLGIIHSNAGKYDLARKELQTVRKKYPGSTAAHLASQQLSIIAKKNL
jgi:tol-pal system protein YbgF